MIELEMEHQLEELLDRAWRSIAAAGWNRYQLHGRGALLASTHMLAGKSDSMDFITPSDNAPLPDWLESAISRYDPDTSIVLVFVEDGVYQGAARQVGSDLLEEHLGLLSGPAYFKVVSRTPPPRDCARGLAN